MKKSNRRENSNQGKGQKQPPVTEDQPTKLDPPPKEEPTPQKPPMEASIEKTAIPAALARAVATAAIAFRIPTKHI